MNIGRFFNEKLRGIRNSDGSLKQVLILASLAVIFGGFGNRQGLTPSYSAPEPPPDFGGFSGFGFEQNGPEGYGEEGYGPWDMGPFRPGQDTAGPGSNSPKGPNFEGPIRYGPGMETQKSKGPRNERQEKHAWVETDRKKKHKHHHREEREDKIPRDKPEVQYDNEELTGDLNSSEVPYTVE